MKRAPLPPLDTEHTGELAQHIVRAHQAVLSGILTEYELKKLEHTMQRNGLYLLDANWEEARKYVARNINPATRDRFIRAGLETVDVIKALDPAGKNPEATIYGSWPGVFIAEHQPRARELYKIHPQLAYNVCEQIFTKTGCRIYPNTQLGRYVFFDHPGGSVFGDQAIIGDFNMLYHGATMGSRSGLDINGRRHPKTESGVFMASSSIATGPITIGAHCIIGANSHVFQADKNGNVAPGLTIIRENKVISLYNPFTKQRVSVDKKEYGGEYPTINSPAFSGKIAAQYEIFADYKQRHPTQPPEDFLGDEGYIVATRQYIAYMKEAGMTT